MTEELWQRLELPESRSRWRRYPQFDAGALWTRRRSATWRSAAGDHHCERRERLRADHKIDRRNSAQRDAECFGTRTRWRESARRVRMTGIAIGVHREARQAGSDVSSTPDVRFLLKIPHAADQHVSGFEKENEQLEKVIANSNAAARERRFHAKAPEKVVRDDSRRRWRSTRRSSGKIAAALGAHDLRHLSSRRKRAVESALAEDLGSGDITTECVYRAELHAEARFVAKQDMTWRASSFSRLLFDDRCDLQKERRSGDRRDELIVIGARTGAKLLTRERVSLNFLQRLSGVATLAAKFVAAVEGNRGSHSGYSQNHARVARAGKNGRRGRRRRSTIAWDFTTRC